MQLRPYQERIVSDLISFIHNNPTKAPLVEACVGAGKSVMIAVFIKRMIEIYPHLKFLNLVHTKELVEQNYAKFKAVMPNISSGLYMGSLNKKEHDKQVVYGSIQSVYDKIDLFKPNILMIDECHWISKKASKGMYRLFIEGLKERFPHLVIIGWTGTSWRMDGGSLIHGDERLFDEICGQVGIRELLDLGFLSPLTVPKDKIQTKFDTSSLKPTANGDFNSKKLAEILDDRYKIDQAIDEYYRLSSGRKKHLIFGSSIEHCEHIKDSAARFYKVEFIHGSMNKKDREKYIEMFRNGELDMLVSGIILTTGFDVPDVDSIGLLRDTASSALYVQIAGRGLRIADGKQDCLWIDFTETTDRHGAVDKVEAPIPAESGSGTAIKKQCYNCELLIPAATRTCPNCGAEFEIEAGGVNHKTEASTADVLTTYKKPEWQKVKNITWSLGTPLKQRGKDNAEQYLKLSLLVGLESIPLYMSFEGHGRYMACELWKLLVKDDHAFHCPQFSSVAKQVLDSGGLKEINEVLVDYNNVSYYYTNNSGKRVKSKNPTGHKLLGVR